MHPQLENYSWNCLSGSQKQFTVGTESGVRYAPGFSNIIAFPDLGNVHIDAMLPYCAIGEHLYCSGWTGSPTVSWKVLMEGAMCLMLFDGEMPTAQHDKEIVQLTSKHVPDMMELTELVSPGPFGPRTCELGEYIGVFEGERLVSMAGERLWAPPYREISAVCTHPDYQGKGLARRLMEELISRQLKRGEVPTLHVISSNQRAYDLYTRLGYERYKEYAVRLITRVS